VNVGRGVTAVGVFYGTISACREWRVGERRRLRPPEKARRRRAETAGSNRLACLRIAYMVGDELWGGLILLTLGVCCAALFYLLNLTDLHHCTNAGSCLAMVTRQLSWRNVLTALY